MYFATSKEVVEYQIDNNDKIVYNIIAVLTIMIIIIDYY